MDTEEQKVDFGDGFDVRCVIDLNDLNRELAYKIGKLDEKIERLNAAVNTINNSIHSIGNMVSGKVGAKELEIIVKQIVEDALKNPKRELR